MKVLYIDGVGPFGGASRSLYEVLNAEPAKQVGKFFLGVDGTALGYYGRVATDLVRTSAMSRFDNTLYSHYRGIRWLVVLREIWNFPRTIFGVLNAKRSWGGVDLIHINEITDIIPGLIAKRLFKTPMIVHVRSLAWWDTKSFRCKWLLRKLELEADALIAIDESVNSTLPKSLNAYVIHNSFPPNGSVAKDRLIVEKIQALRSSSLKVGFVGNLHHSKGLFDLLDAAKMLHSEGIDAEFIVVGGLTRGVGGFKGWLLRKTGFAQDIYDQVVARIGEFGLGDHFHLMGPTDDIKSVYDSIDILCFPSHFNAPGRPVFEAAFSGVPSIVAVDEPRMDTLIPGETGLAIPMRNPERLAEAIRYFIDNPKEIKRMGNNARRLAEENFDPNKNAKKLISLYSKVINEHRSKHGWSPTQI